MSLVRASEALSAVRADLTTWLTLYAALLLLIPSKLVFPILGSAGAPSMLFGLASLLLWLMMRAAALSSGPFLSQPLRISVVAFLFSVGISYTLAMAGPISADEISPADVALLTCASWAGTFLIADEGVTSRQRLDDLVWRLTLLGGTIAALGIVQVLTAESWVDRLALPGLVWAEEPGLATRGAFTRPAGTASHPIEFGILVTMILPLAIHVGLHHRRRTVLLRWLPAMALAAIVPITTSRSAYVGAIVGLTVCSLGWTNRQRIGLLVFGALGVAVLVWAAPGRIRFIGDLFTGAAEDPSILSRTDSFGLAGEFVLANPLFGRGLGTFLPKYRIFDNQYLLLLVSIGIIGTACFLGIGVVASVTMLRLKAHFDTPDTRSLRVSLVAAIAVGFASLGMFDTFAFPMTMGTLFLILGTSAALRRIEMLPPRDQ